MELIANVANTAQHAMMENWCTGLKENSLTNRGMTIWIMKLYIRVKCMKAFVEVDNQQALI